MITPGVIQIPDLGTSNLASVCNMITRCGGNPRVVAKPGDLEPFERVVLAGVGAFDAGMRSLRDRGWIDPLFELASSGRVPVLGICLGMQLMCRASDEGRSPGLGWFEAEARRIAPPPDSGLKVPHMGWNTVECVRPTPLLSEGEPQRFYFVHAYHVVCRETADVSAVTDHGGEIVAAIHRDNIFGVQFHPEKSHRFGLSVFQRFLDLHV